MKLVVNFAAMIMLTFLSLETLGQVIINPESDTIKWEYGNIENKRRIETINIKGHIISYGKSGFLWIQNGTKTEYFFKILSSKGQWDDIERSGELIYRAVCQNIEGTIRIFKKGKQAKIHLDFTQQDRLTPNIILQVNSYTKI